MYSIYNEGAVCTDFSLTCRHWKSLYFFCPKIYFFFLLELKDGSDGRDVHKMREQSVQTGSLSSWLVGRLIIGSSILNSIGKELSFDPAARRNKGAGSLGDPAHLFILGVGPNDCSFPVLLSIEELTIELTMNRQVREPCLYRLIPHYMYISSTRTVFLCNTNR